MKDKRIGLAWERSKGDILAENLYNARSTITFNCRYSTETLYCCSSNCDARHRGVQCEPSPLEIIGYIFMSGWVKAKESNISFLCPTCAKQLNINKMGNKKKLTSE